MTSYLPTHQRVELPAELLPASVVITPRLVLHRDDNGEITGYYLPILELNGLMILEATNMMSHVTQATSLELLDRMPDAVDYLGREVVIAIAQAHYDTEHPVNDQARSSIFTTGQLRFIYDLRTELDKVDWTPLRDATARLRTSLADLIRSAPASSSSPATTLPSSE